MNPSEHATDSPVVSIVQIDSYEPEVLDQAVQRLLEPLGGMQRYAESGRDVLLKPNFLKPAVPEACATTHPEMIRSVARLAAAGGASSVIVSDSPAVSSVARCAAKLGIGDDEPFEIMEPGQGQEISFPGGRFKKVKISKRMLEAKSIINIAKAKSHAQMVLTLATKNMFGAVVGLEKAQWHFRSGKDENVFARLLVEVHESVRPRLNILDAITGMEGNGPGSGDPRQLGLIMASASAHALDAVFCRIIGIDPLQVPTIRAARELGLLDSFENIRIIGPDPESLRPDPKWKLARPIGLRLLPGPLARILDRFLEIIPSINGRKCTMCGECVRVCAAEAMSLQKSKNRAVLKRKKCISCFCCQEICPEGAIRARAGFLARLLGLGKS